jgi:hypothetical protein
MLDRFLSGILDRARAEPDQQSGQTKATPVAEPVPQVQQGPER